MVKTPSQGMAWRAHGILTKWLPILRGFIQAVLPIAHASMAQALIPNPIYIKFLGPEYWCLFKPLQLPILKLKACSWAPRDHMNISILYILVLESQNMADSRTPIVLWALLLAQHARAPGQRPCCPRPSSVAIRRSSSTRVASATSPRCWGPSAGQHGMGQDGL